MSTKLIKKIAKIPSKSSKTHLKFLINSMTKPQKLIHHLNEYITSLTQDKMPCDVTKSVIKIIRHVFEC